MPCVLTSLLKQSIRWSFGVLGLEIRRKQQFEIADTHNVNKPNSREDTDITSSSFMDWIRSRVQSQSFWFHKIELTPDLVTPGWDDPKANKLPYFGPSCGHDGHARPRHRLL
jgi:hypothetical protein